MKHLNCIKIIGILSVLFLLVACGGGGGGGAASVGTSIIDITVGSNGATAKVETSEDTLFARVKEFFNLFSPEEAVAQIPIGILDCGIPPEVDSIVFNISGSGISIPPRTAQVNHDGIHECEVTERFEIPNGTGIVFTADALTAGGQKVYSGLRTANVPAPGNLVEIPMERECNLYVDEKIGWDYWLDSVGNNIDKKAEKFKLANLTDFLINLITPHEAVAGFTLPSDDSINDCRDSEQPCHSITHAIDQASTGETICVLPGTYIPDYSSNCGDGSAPEWGDDECYPLNVTKDITLLCIGSNQSCVLEGNAWWDSDRPIADTGVMINGTSEIHNFTIQDFPPFIGSLPCDNCDTGIKVMSGTPTISGNLMRNNIIGMAISAGSPNIVGNTIIENGLGMRILLSTENPVITGNTIACNFQSDVFLNETGGLINLSNNTWDEPLEVIQNLTGNECIGVIGVDVCYEGTISPDTSGATFTECFFLTAS